MIKKLARDTLAIILLGLILRLIIAPFTLNWDFLANMHLAAKMDTQSLSEFYKDPLANYPPLMYKTLSVIYNFTRTFSGNLIDNWFAADNLTAVSSVYIFRILFLLKLPFIIIDIACGVIFSRLFNVGKRNVALLAWMVNPISLYLVAAWTNVDITTLLFILLNFYFFSKNKFLLSVFALGMAVSFKFFPLFFVPFLIFSTNNWKKRIIYALTLALPVITTHLAVIGVPNYFNQLLAGGHSRSVLFATLPIGADRALIYFYFIYFIVFLYYLSVKTKNYFIFSLFSIVPIFAFSKFNLQWFIWLLPLVLYSQVKSEKLSPNIILLYASFFFLVLLSQASLNIGMLAPIDATLWNLEWPLKKIFGDENIFSMLNMVHTLFAASLIFLSYRIFKNYEKA